MPRICAAILDAVNASGRTRTELGEALGVSQQAVSSWTKHIEPSLDTIESLEHVLGLESGAILRAAGYVGAAEGVDHAIGNDTRLTVDERAMLKAAYRATRVRR